jgi:hypothetical protein
MLDVCGIFSIDAGTRTAAAKRRKLAVEENAVAAGVIGED